MPANLRRIAVPLLFLVVTARLPASTTATDPQGGTFPTLSSTGSGAAAGYVGAGPFGQGVQGQPYVLTQKTTQVQTLADGSHITRLREEHRMQDSQGRTRIEMSQDRNGTMTLVMITIVDPVGRTWTHLSPIGKRADVMHLPESRSPSPEQAARRTERLAELRAKAEAGRTTPPAQQGNRPRITSEVLPPRSVAGVYAEGRRITRVIPANRQGNDRELHIVIEEWTSPDLHVQLERTVDDPVQGKSTMEVTSLERSEPDPALFGIPPGYTVVEKAAQQQ